MFTLWGGLHGEQVLWLEGLYDKKVYIGMMLNGEDVYIVRFTWWEA